MVTVVIPTYKTVPEHYESRSLERIFDVLANYPITFAVPNSLNLDWYKTFCLSKNREAVFERFDDKNFDGIEGYNGLLLSPAFYRRFFDYKYMLICQLDVFLFSDELASWCNRNYDYIGAPWPYSGWIIEVQQKTKDFILHRQPSVVHPFLRFGWKFRSRFLSQSLRVGNGGLSLRKVKKLHDICQTSEDALREWPYNEDLFFSVYAPLRFSHFNVPSWEVAAGFSVDNAPGLFYSDLNGKKPFGCHAWYRDSGPYEGNFKFWQPVIEQVDPAFLSVK